MPLAASITRTRSTATLALLALAAGCSDAPTASRGPGSMASKAALTPEVSAAQTEALSQVARVLALGLGDAGAAALVKDEFRASPYVQHALDLRTFLRTAAGGRVLAVAAQRGNVTTATLAAAVASLPALDVVVPRPQDRRAWDGTGPLVVLASLARNAQQARGYTADGVAVTYDAAVPAVGLVLVVLHPSGAHNTRMDPQPAGPGRTIQDATDGEGSATYTAVSTDGNISVTRFTSRAQLQRFNATRGGASHAAELAGPRASLAVAPGAVAAPGLPPATPSLIACGDPGSDPSCNSSPTPPPPPTSGATYIQTAWLLNSCRDTFLGVCIGNDLVWNAHPTGMSSPSYRVELDGWGTTESRNNTHNYFFPYLPYKVPMFVSNSEADGHYYGDYVLDASNTPNGGGNTGWFSTGDDRCDPSTGFVCSGYPNTHWREMNTIFQLQP